MTELILEKIHFLVISRALHHLVYFGFDGGYIQEQSANDTNLLVSVKCVCVFLGKLPRIVRNFVLINVRTIIVKIGADVT